MQTRNSFRARLSASLRRLWSRAALSGRPHPLVLLALGMVCLLSRAGATGTTNIEAFNVAGGSNHTVALKSDGTVWTWGLNSQWPAGQRHDRERPVPTQVGGLKGAVAVTAGDYHTVALK